MTRIRIFRRALGVFGLLLLLSAVLAATGCRRTVKGPHSWWDDKTGRPLPPNYKLPPEEEIKYNESWQDLLR